MNPVDLFEANDLSESGNTMQVQVSLLALAGKAKTKGLQSGVDIGVKYSEKQERNFDDATMKAGQCVIGLQVGDSSPSPRDHGVGGPRCWGTAALGDSGMEPCSPSISGRDRKLVGCSLTSPTNLPADGHQQMRQPVGHDRVRHEEASL